MRFTRNLVVLMMGLVLASCGLNSVPTAEENAKAKWADVEAAFQRRANLIPNLSAIVSSASENERETLTAVIEARSKASSIQISADDLNDPEKVATYQAAQNQLTGSLSRLLANVEAYPELKSQNNYATFMSQIEGAENRVNISIRDYNEAVRQYNTTIRTFPAAIGAKIFHGAEPMVPYQAVTPGAEVAPDVEL